MLRVLALIVVVLATAHSSYGQSVEDRRKELQRLKSSIESTRNRIDALRKRESGAMKSLTSVQRQRHRLAAFIAELEADLTALRDSATSVQRGMEQTRSELRAAEQAYSDASSRLLALKARRRGSEDVRVTTDVMYRTLTENVTTYADRMRRLTDSLDEQKTLLEAYSSTQEQLLATKAQEDRQLTTTIAKSRSQLASIRKNRTSLERELSQKRRSLSKMSGIIANLEKKERAQRARREREARARANRTKTPEITPAPPRHTAGGFAPRSLPWPTASRTLIHGYGTYRNEATGTTFENPGIDIKSGNGSRVTAVADGDVSSVSFLPGFGSLVIIDHHNGYRTVYANLATVTVREGSNVRAGTTLGTSGENVDGELVHFEIWYGRTRKNPSAYLR